MSSRPLLKIIKITRYTDPQSARADGHDDAWVFADQALYATTFKVLATGTIATATTFIWYLHEAGLTAEEIYKSLARDIRPAAHNIMRKEEITQMARDNT